LTNQLTRLTMLNKAARAMSELKEPDEVLDRILDLTSEVFGFHACAILLIEQPSGELVIRRARGYDSDVVKSFRGKPGEGVTGQALMFQEPVLVTDVSADRGYIQGVQGAVSEVAVPLFRNGELLGVLDAESRLRLDFSPDDLELLSAFASQAAVALYNSQIHDQLARKSAALERQLEVQGLIAQASEALIGSLDLESLLEEILKLAEQALRFECCAVLLLDGAGHQLNVSAARGYKDGVHELEIPLGCGITGDVMRTGEAVLVPDVQRDSRYIEGVSGGRCEMAVPIRVRGELLGVLDAEAREVGAFTEEDLELFAIFASNVAIAILNARQFAELGDRAAELSILNQVGERITSILDFKTLLDEILDLSHNVLPFDQCALLLLDEVGEELVVKAGYGYRNEVAGMTIPVGRGITGEAARTGETIVVPDVMQDPRYIHGVADGRSELAVPLVVNGKTIGVLDAEAKEPEAFGEIEQQLFQTFASWAAVAVHNARLYSDLERANKSLQEYLDEMERMNQELTTYGEQISSTNRDLEARVGELVTLHRASQTISSSLDLGQTLDTIVELTGNILHASSGAIRLLDEEAEELRTKARLEGDEQAPDGGDGASEEAPHLEAPLKIGDRVIGVFELGKENGEFTEEEKRMLDTLASQAAVAIENARLFERTQKMYYETIRSLAEALEARDSYTRGHSDRVTRYALAVAEEMEVSAEDLRVIGHAGLLHDIGKIGIRDTILHKTTMLSKQDREAIESHPLFGDTILGPIKFLDNVQTVVRHHHERFDGKGYPDGLKGDDIPLAARIVAVGDAFDAMTSDRPYRDAMSRDAAIAELKQVSGSQLDPEVVDVFLGLLETRFTEEAMSEDAPPPEEAEE